MVTDCIHPKRLRAVSNQLFLGSDPVVLRGACLTPLEPIGRHEDWNGGFGAEQATLALLHQAHGLGLNALRVYLPPPTWFLSSCKDLGFFLFVDLSWNAQCDFLSTTAARKRIEQSVLERLRLLNKHEAVAGIFIGNELPPDLVRWHGVERCSRFLDHLIRKARAEWDEPLYGYAGYPPSDAVAPKDADFCALNLYPKDRQALRRFLQRGMQWAGERPLLLSEIGLDAGSHGENQQAEFLAAVQEESNRAGNAGFFWFALTDRWWRSGQSVSGWHFGLFTAAGTKRPAAEMMHAEPSAAKVCLKVTIVVCVRDGALHIGSCLKSLLQIEYPNLEIVVVDDGSRDETPTLVAAFARSDKRVRLVRQESLGLSAARNRGVSEACGEIVAFTDADCRVDRNWVAQLALRFTEAPWSGMGGFNLSTEPASWQQACVASAPGGAWHVLLDDEEAEHVPGCNMAFRKEVFAEVGGFQPQFTAAGDDVDFCWRVRERGGRIGFASGAVVWHERRRTIWGFLRQQWGYGRAEALLRLFHPDVVSLWGISWAGAIYGGGGRKRKGLATYSGPYGSAGFQTLYGSSAARSLPLPRGYRSLIFQLCVGFLAIAQMSVRHIARWSAWRSLACRPKAQFRSGTQIPARVALLARDPIDGPRVLRGLQQKLASRGWAVIGNTGWHPWDLKVWESATVWVEINTLVEAMENGREWILHLRCKRRGFGLRRLQSTRHLRAELNHACNEIVHEFEFKARNHNERAE